jgi:hypothetical protein
MRATRVTGRLDTGPARISARLSRDCDTSSRLAGKRLSLVRTHPPVAALADDEPTSGGA